MVDLELGSFRSVKVPRNDACLACGTASTLSWAQLEAQGTSDTACALIAPNKSKVSDDHRTSCEAYVKERHGPHILLDVRDPSQFAVCALPNALNVPLRHLSARVEEVKAKGLPVFVMCRRGVDSLAATELLVSAGVQRVKNIDGGLCAWHSSVDPMFPLY